MPQSAECHILYPYVELHPKHVTFFFKLGESVFSSFVRAAVKLADTTNASARRADKRKQISAYSSESDEAASRWYTAAAAICNVRVCQESVS